MKPSVLRAAQLAAPRQQRNWDWRAAANFICGGAGGGLLLFASLAELEPGLVRAAILLGLLLIGCGLTCVWFEIGRPWRALNVYRHFASSWMTREAVVALLLFASGALAWLSVQPQLVGLSGFLGLAFVYSQARILAANKGIPAWRHPRSIPLLMATGLTEGAGFLTCLAVFFPAPVGNWLLLSLITLLSVRAWGWKMYLAGLAQDGAPDGALRALNAFDRRFMLLGNGLPAILTVMALTGMPGRAALLFAAGALVVGGGWLLKFTLVRRAAFTQGLALQHLPARGKGPAGPAAKPGWKIMDGASKV